MDDQDSWSILGNALDAFKREKEADIVRRRESLKKSATFNDSWNIFRATVARPALDEVVAKLDEANSGHWAEVLEYQSGGNHTIALFFALTGRRNSFVLPADGPPAGETGFAIEADSKRQKVRFIAYKHDSVRALAKQQLLECDLDKARSPEIRRWAAKVVADEIHAWLNARPAEA